MYRMQIKISTAELDNIFNISTIKDMIAIFVITIFYLLVFVLALRAVYFALSKTDPILAITPKLPNLLKKMMKREKAQNWIDRG